ncbi:MAG: hypothetical protein ACE366_02675 [Bradymonadia bacterium]
MKAPRRVQATLQALYGLEPGVDVGEFIVGRRQRAQIEQVLGPLDGGRETLWVTEDQAGLSVALYLDDELHHVDPTCPEDLDRHSVVIEGVSHLLYVLHRAGRDQRVSQLELEIQAEVDKFLATWRTHHDARAPLELDGLLVRLFDHVHITARGAEAGRYRAANRLARRYCRSLYRRFLQPDRLEPMWREIRRFWRMSQPEKIGLIEGV